MTITSGGAGASRGGFGVNYAIRLRRGSARASTYLQGRGRLRLEQGRAETRPGFNLAYCLRMGTAYFAWFFEGVYQHIKKEGLYKT